MTILIPSGMLHRMYLAAVLAYTHSLAVVMIMRELYC